MANVGQDNRHAAKFALLASVVAALALPLHAHAADLSRRDVHPMDYWSPYNVHTNQFNNDGTPISWIATSKTTTVYFMSHSEMKPNTNGCPVCATWQIELLEVDTKTAKPPFSYKPTNNISGGCSVIGDSAPSFDISSGFLTLKPHSAYKWQSRMLATYLTAVTNNSGTTCEVTNITPAPYASPWEVGVGFMVPGYGSFFTP